MKEGEAGMTKGNRDTREIHGKKKRREKILDAFNSNRCNPDYFFYLVVGGINWWAQLYGYYTSWALGTVVYK
jgi:hypothetical protein